MRETGKVSLLWTLPGYYINKIWKNELILIFWRYLHACSPILLKNSKLGAIVAGGYSDKYLNSTEIYFPEENR